MKKHLIIYLTVIGLIGLFSSCENDETRVVMSANPILPTIVTMPDLTLIRDNGTQVLTFVGTPVDPGFQASVIYYLEGCPSGNKFVDVTTILSSPQDAELKITVSDLNGILLKAFPADQVSTVDFRIRSVLVADAGTGVSPLVSSSPTKSAQVTLYGLPRLDLLGSGIDQKIESALGDGKYSGYVKLSVKKKFKLLDPDLGNVYGGSGGVLILNGDSIAPETDGYSYFIADTKALTFTLTQYEIGLVGSATVNNWDAPDTKLSYDSKTGTWYINNVDLKDGEIKFRFNDGWAWNLGWNAGKTALEHNGANIAVAAGNYNIRLTITQFAAPETGKFTIVKN